MRSTNTWCGGSTPRRRATWPPRSRPPRRRTWPTPHRGCGGRWRAVARVELDRERDLVGGGHREQLVAPEIERRRRPATGERLGIGEAVELVGRAETGVVARVDDRLRDHVGVERACPRVALTVIGDHSHADAFDLGDGQRLDLTVEHLHVDVARPHRVRLDLLAGAGGARDGAGHCREVDVTHRPLLMPRCRPR